MSIFRRSMKKKKPKKKPVNVTWDKSDMGYIESEQDVAQLCQDLKMLLADCGVSQIDPNQQYKMKDLYNKFNSYMLKLTYRFNWYSTEVGYEGLDSDNFMFLLRHIFPKLTPADTNNVFAWIEKMEHLAEKYERKLASLGFEKKFYERQTGSDYSTPPHLPQATLQNLYGAEGRQKKHHIRKLESPLNKQIVKDPSEVTWDSPPLPSKEQFDRRVAYQSRMDDSQSTPQRSTGGAAFAGRSGRDRRTQSLALDDDDDSSDDEFLFVWEDAEGEHRAMLNPRQMKEIQRKLALAESSGDEYDFDDSSGAMFNPREMKETQRNLAEIRKRRNEGTRQARPLDESSAWENWHDIKGLGLYTRPDELEEQRRVIAEMYRQGKGGTFIGGFRY